MMKQTFAVLLLVAIPGVASAESFSTCQEAGPNPSFLSRLGGSLHDIFDKVEDRTEAAGKKIGDHAIDGAAQLVGYTELLGLRYPVKTYQFEVSPTLTRGSRLDAKGIAALGARGFKSIVDLTLEGTHDGIAARAAGMTPYNIRILDNSHPTNAQMKQFLDIVTAPKNQPAYVHCEAGKGRTGISVAVYRMAVEGWPLDRAMAEAKTFGVSLPNQKKYLEQFSKDLAAGKIAGYPRAAVN